ncbi:MAG: hypothetical protein IIT39_07750 [Clostridia bacterium]|nr:hypothetical protein [Clostridia bacterium]
MKRKISAIILTLFLGAAFLSGCTNHIPGEDKNSSSILVSDSEKNCCQEKSDDTSKPDCCKDKETSHIPDCCGE